MARRRSEGRSASEAVRDFIEGYIDNGAPRRPRRPDRFAGSPARRRRWPSAAVAAPLAGAAQPGGRVRAAGRQSRRAHFPQRVQCGRRPAGHGKPRTARAHPRVERLSTVFSPGRREVDTIGAGPRLDAASGGVWSTTSSTRRPRQGRPTELPRVPPLPRAPVQPQQQAAKVQPRGPASRAARSKPPRQDAGRDRRGRPGSRRHEAHADRLGQRLSAELSRLPPGRSTGPAAPHRRRWCRPRARRGFESREPPAVRQGLAHLDHVPRRIEVPGRRQPLPGHRLAVDQHQAADQTGPGRRAGRSAA